MRGLNRLISNLYNEELKKSGITVSQFNILTAIIKTQPVAPSKIGTILRLEKSTLSRNLDLLGRKGWIETRGSGRNLRVVLTQAGGHTYARGGPHWETAQRKASAIVGPEGHQVIECWLQAAKDAVRGQ